ncbi:MAG: RdgB/HAM1 family non-canonical purine NTP pyrophosphatase [Ruminococcus sp.]|jgi:XTP/dITP diphosphohydrolase|nr:RdgB/HAM1 family non-canonical purine NTP pyrophosphatase [Ruminococcus sp.]
MIAATNNPGKLREIREILGGGIISLSEAGIVSEPVEDGLTLRDNAYIKAKAAFRNVPVIADDSGLFIAALDGAPGVNSARFDVPGKRRGKVLKLLEGVTERAAYFETVICYFDGVNTEFFTGRLDGVIAHENRGEFGFGYDSIFEVDGLTLAEIPDKNKISHRKKALEKLKEYLEKL